MFVRFQYYNYCFLNHRIELQQRFSGKVGKAVGKVTSIQPMNELRSRLDNQVVDGDATYLQLCIDILEFKTYFDIIEPVGETKQPPCARDIPSGGKGKTWEYKSLAIACITNQKNVLDAYEPKNLATCEVF
jgi:hypothetical protein